MAATNDDGAIHYKLVVLGAGAVGKSSLTVRYITDNFLDEYDPTIEDYYRKLVTIDSTPALLDILDTAGQEEFTSMQDEFFRHGKGFLLVYSITSAPSFHKVEELREQILRARENEPFALVLAGNKCDLVDKRAVSESEGKALAKEWNCPFFETSAKDKINNAICFEEIVREIRRRDAKGGNRKQRKGWCLVL